MEDVTRDQIEAHVLGVALEERVRMRLASRRFYRTPVIRGGSHSDEWREDERKNTAALRELLALRSMAKRVSKRATR
jgi:hypothetical protein